MKTTKSKLPVTRWDVCGALAVWGMYILIQQFLSN